MAFTKKGARVGRPPSKQQAVAEVKKGRKPPPENETKRERFLRIAAPRMASTLHSIRLLSNLARGDYEWTEGDVLRMRAAIDVALNLAFGEFERAQGVKKLADSFSFNGN